MKMKIVSTILMGLCLLPLAAWAQTFDSGSDGSYGPLNVTTSTNLVVPPDGIFHCTTINISPGGGNNVVTFTRDALNTPVYLLAQSNVVLSGTISIAGGNYSGSNPGRGGPGGFDGGFGPIQGYSASDGQGPGGGKVSANSGGVFALPQTGNSNVYGNTLLVPLLGGSGGAGGAGGGGGGGGGAIVIASSTRITLNRNNTFNNPGFDIYAGGGGGAGGGSGGAVRLVAPVVDGNGIISVAGGSIGGGGGRIRIDTLARLDWRNLVFSGGKATVGAQMVTGIPDNRRLDIVEAAGLSIPVGTTNRVNVTLPVGSSTNQVVKVRASGFTNDVPITVAVIPESGSSTRFESVISANGANPVTNTVNVVIPVDTVTYLQVWSK
jgi:hypothetical protein